MKIIGYNLTVFSKDSFLFSKVVHKRSMSAIFSQQLQFAMLHFNTMQSLDSTQLCQQFRKSHRSIMKAPLSFWCTLKVLRRSSEARVVRISFSSRCSSSSTVLAGIRPYINNTGRHITMVHYWPSDNDFALYLPMRDLADISRDPALVTVKPAKLISYPRIFLPESQGRTVPWKGMKQRSWCYNVLKLFTIKRLRRQIYRLR